MHRASRNSHAISEGPLLRFESWKRGQQRGMNVQNTLRKLLHKPGREQTHVSREANQIDFVPLEGGDDFAIVRFALCAPRGDHQRLQSALAGDGDSKCVGLVGDYYRYACVWNAPGVDAVGDGGKVRAPSGKKYADGFHGRLNDNSQRRQGDKAKFTSPEDFPCDSASPS